MNLQTFKAATMAEALAQVKHAMGHDAVILHTRSYHQREWLGLRRREIVEITAGRGLRVQERRRPTATVTAVSNVPKKTAPAIAGYAPQARSLSEAGRQILETPGGGSAVMLALRDEMSGLRTMVKDLVSQVRHNRTPDVPEELFDYYMQLISSQVCDELALEVIKNLHRQIRPEHLQQPQYIRERLIEQLEKQLPATGPIVRTKSVGPHVVALIGPTGVGKTTTIAKLAANLKLREKRRVGLITIDTYRIAAIDQLKKYADIIGSPLRVVGSPDDLREAVASMSEYDFVLIDTAGRSPNDTLKLNELKHFLSVASPDEVHLVLSTTASQSCVELAIERFGDVRCEKIIFTKLDEAAHVGVVLNVVRKVNKSLSYITTGQDVPDDIEVGQGRKLAQLILGTNL
jgi:flagellar biosynthesis protein FlhF